MIVEQFLDESRFTSAEKQVIDFIQKVPNVIINLSLEELCAECHVSQASVIRLCKKLGTKGYSDFKIALAKELYNFVLDDQQISVDVPIRAGSSNQEIADRFFSLSRHALEKAKNGLNLTELSRAASMIATADIVHIYGRGESLILAEDLTYKLSRIGKHCLLEPLNGFSENHNIKRANGRIRECALVISQYCNSTQVHYIIDELVSAKIPFILLTAAVNLWPYDKYAECVLRIDCQESRYKMGCFESRTAFTYVLDCLYGIVFSKDYEKNSEHLLQCARQKAAHDYFYTYLTDTK